MTGTVPRASVVIPLYNRAATIERTLRSVLAQTVSDFEIIVVDDGSSDDGPDRVEAIGDPRIRSIRAERGGVSRTRNRGVAESRAPIVAFLDSDDEWDPRYLETILRLADRFPGCAVFATGYTFRDPHGHTRAPRIVGFPDAKDDFLLRDYFEVAARSEPPLWTSAVAARKDAILSVGGFDERIWSGEGEDLLLWAKLCAHHEAAVCPEPLATYWVASARDPRPDRRPLEPDIVGEQLRELLENPRITKRKRDGLRRYLGRWHHIRGSQWLELGERRKAWREALDALRLAPGKFRRTLYLGWIAVPAPIRAVVRRAVRGGNESARRVS